MKNDQAPVLSPAELLLELKVLVSEAETMMANSLSGHSAHDFGSLRERFGVVQERFGEACAGARKKVVAGVKYADETIRANPYQSLAIAAGVGLLVGGLVGVMVARRND
jgi:ElaB/YqjD/DUF883 family membrane-anchored ribosome-binding protein